MGEMSSYLFALSGEDAKYRFQFKDLIFAGKDGTQNWFENKYKESERQELSNIINSFQIGQKVENIKKEDAEKYYLEQGKHFCAGYLSKFKNKTEIKISVAVETPETFKQAIHKIQQRKKYGALYVLADVGTQVLELMLLPTG